MPIEAGLLFDSLVKSFGGTRALRGVSLRVNRGEIVVLLGKNGADKSTLIKILCGIHTPDSRQVSVDGAPCRHVGGKVSTKQAVTFIHQDLGLIEWMSVAENIALAVGYPKRSGRIDWPATEKLAREALALVEADFAPTARVSSLTRTEKSLGAIARALAVECDFLVLDEPSASLPADEVERLFAALRALRAKGVGMIYVSHRLDEVFRISGRPGRSARRGPRGNWPGTFRHGAVHRHRAAGWCRTGPDLTSPCIAMTSGVGFVARDRVVESVAPALTIRENTFLDPSASGRKPVSFMAPRAENALASNLGSRVGLTPNDPTLPIEALSGGNQQKVATLGTGTVLYAIALWHTGGRQVVGALDPNFYRLSRKWVLGLPITGF